MANLEFNSTLFRTSSDVAAAIAGEWMTAGGSNNAETVLEFFAKYSDEQLVDEAISGWDLEETINGDEVRWDESGETEPQTWLESRGLDRNALVRAFADYRKKCEKRAKPAQQRILALDPKTISDLIVKKWREASEVEVDEDGDVWADTHYLTDDELHEIADYLEV